MIKYFIFVFNLLFLIPIQSYALNLNNGDTVNVNNLHLYFEENYFDETRPYCVYNQTQLTIKCYTLDSNGKTPLFMQYSNGQSWVITGDYSITFFSTLHSFDSDFNITTRKYTTTSYQSQVGLNSDVYYTNFDLKDVNNPDNILIAKNWSSAPKLFNVTFDIPSSAKLVLKDSNNAIVEPSSKNVYQLESGSYTYSVTNGGYKEVIDVSITVNEDMTIKPEMVSVTSDYDSWFKSFITQIKNMILILQDNILFLVGISSILTISIILILIKLVKGGF